VVERGREREGEGKEEGGKKEERKEMVCQQLKPDVIALASGETGRFGGRKSVIDNSGGGLIKSAISRFLERAINGRIVFFFNKFRYFGQFWGELGPLMTPFGVDLAILGANFPH
jgi:hypothetical protein